MPQTKGLAGVVAAHSAVSSIIDDQLTYVGYQIDDLAEKASFEEVIYLLWHQELPNVEELRLFKRDIIQAMELPEVVIQHLRSYNPHAVHPMAALRTAISFLGMLDPEADIQSEEANMRKAIRLQAQTASIIAAFARIRQGKEPVKPRLEYGYAENFLYMLNNRKPEAIEIEAIDKALVLHADHELNASTFTARVSVATLSDIYSGITAAISALKGPLHGGANEGVMNMLLEIGTEDNAIPYVKDKLIKKEKIMGVGHRVYKTADPRAKHLKTLSKKLTILKDEEKWYNISVQIEEFIKAEKNLPVNVDFYSASVYHSLGIETDLFTPIFAMSRVSGWVAHILEQFKDNRLIRPRAQYTGPEHQEFIKLEERE